MYFRVNSTLFHSSQSLFVFFIFSCSLSLSPICHLIRRCTLRWGYTCAFLRERPHALVALYRVSPAQNFSKYNAVKIQRQATLTKSWIMQRRVSRRGWKGGGEERREESWAKEKWVTDSSGGKVPPLSSGVFPRCIFPRVLFLSSRPLRRSFLSPLFLPLLVRRFFHSPLATYFSRRDRQSCPRVPLFSRHSWFFVLHRFKRDKEKG